MTEKIDENAPEDFAAEIDVLVKAITKELGLNKSRWYYDDASETLYIEIEHLETLPEKVIEEKTGIFLDESELDFEEVILLPYS
ncbi:hypothetical protein QLX67_05760 [Balneolaceae bacterium ANBcel3]|nr:hypothetical protein [Balneolaceae bacterium ANBcel3]